MPNAPSGKAVFDAETMGVTLPHEHLLIDFAVMFREPAAASDKGLAYQPVSLANVGWVRAPAAPRREPRPRVRLRLRPPAAATRTGGA
ncbi:MAG TPA: hypothetical protein VFV05_21340 [Methylomirabilota bacterium]|nr:hypothetical protein [Methylomirabilota bacterium]